MKLQAILEQTIPGLGFELVDVEISPGKLIRVFIDKEGGVTVDDCAEVSNHLGKVFLVEEIDYNRLEVSSPGLERPLKKIADYVRFIGRDAKVKTNKLFNEQKVFKGKILKVEDGIINLELEDSQIFKVDFADISRARLIFEPKKK